MSKQKKPIAPPLASIYRKIAISFVVLTALLVGVIVFFSLSKATIIITPKQEIVSAEFLVSAQKAVDNSAVGAAVVGLYEEKISDQEGQFETTGLTDKQGQSQGKIVIKNISSRDQPLVATTRLLSPENALFRTKQGTVVPANGSIEVDVYADQPGAGGDIGSSQFTIPGLSSSRQKEVFGQSKTAMTGGAQKARSVTGDDLEKAKAEIIERAMNKSKEEFGKTPAASLGGILAESEILDVLADAKSGDERQTFSIKAKIKIRLLAYDKAGLEKIALEKVLANIPADRELVKFNKDALVIRVKNADKDNGEAQLSVYGDAEVRLGASSPILDTIKIAGMAPEQAEQYLKSFDAIEKAEVKLFPSWQKRLPTIPDRIKIIIKK